MLIKTQPRQIPQNPGVYFFWSGKKILYIGKAANLRARVFSYFLKNNTSLKVKSLLEESDKLTWKILNSEIEALIRESELIKKYRPKYNVLMRDDKQYFYVGFTQETYPKIFITHQPHKPPLNPLLSKEGKGVAYIGPFTEGAALKSVLKTLRRAFPYCTCAKPHKTLCLNARLGKCFGYCCLNPHLIEVRLQSAADESRTSIKNYLRNIYAIKKILSGKNKSLLNELKREMQKLSKSQKYEEAGKIRNQILALEKIFEHKEVLKRDLPSESLKAIQALESLLKMSVINRIEAYDIANIQGKFAYGSMAVFSEGILNKNEYKIFKIREVLKSDDAAMIKEVILRRFKHPEWAYPDVIIVDGGKGQMNAGLRALNPSKSPLRKVRTTKIIALTKNLKHVGDHMFIENHPLPISLEKLTPSLKNLISHLDSEAHRFAIKFYRKSHRKNLTNDDQSA